MKAWRHARCYCGIVEVKSCSDSGLNSDVDNCSFTRAMKASVEFLGGSVFFSAALGGGITTVWLNSSSSSCSRSSAACATGAGAGSPASAEKSSSISTGGLGGMMLAAGCIGGIGADPSGGLGGDLSALD